MPRGWCPEYFYTNPHLEDEKSMEEIYREIQSYSGEFFIDDIPKYREQTDFIIPLPPLLYEGKFIKGMFLSEGVDYIHALFPRINELFVSMAYTMWSSLPYSEAAEVYLSCYCNPEREAWFKKEYPRKANKIFIPLQDADFTNEYVIAPTFGQQKDIDIVTVARLCNVKNLPLFLKTLMLYETKYGRRLKTTIITGIKDNKYNKDELKILNELEEIAGGENRLKDYVNIEGFVPYGAPLNLLYSRAKLFVLTSIYEGKNRSINEANLCNTPVVVFKDLSKYTRGKDKAFPDGAGLYAPEFSVESLCDTIHNALTNLDKFTPRRSYLRENGRLNFLNKCIDSIPYYRENLPEYVPGRIQDNLWLDLAMQANYQLSFNQFLYGANPAIHHTKLHEKKTDIMDFFNARFMIKEGAKRIPIRREGT